MNNTKTLPIFDLIEKYHEETAKTNEFMQKHREQLEHAQALVKALNYRYEEEVKAAVVEDKDNAKQIEELNEQLSKAECDLENKKRMYLVAQSVSKRTVRKEDVERELRAYQNKYQSEVIAPSEKELRKAKELYISAYLEHMRKIKHFEDQARSAFFAVNPSYNGYNIPYSVGFKTQDNVAHKCITSSDLYDLEQGQPPKSLAPRTYSSTNEKGHIVFLPIQEDVEGENE